MTAIELSTLTYHEAVRNSMIQAVTATVTDANLLELLRALIDEYWYWQFQTVDNPKVTEKAPFTSGKESEDDEDTSPDDLDLQELNLAPPATNPTHTSGTSTDKIAAFLQEVSQQSGEQDSADLPMQSTGDSTGASVVVAPGDSRTAFRRATVEDDTSAEVTGGDGKS